MQNAAVEMHDEKVEALRGIVEELNGNPLLVFYEFVADRERICNAFAARCTIGRVLS